MNFNVDIGKGAVLDVPILTESPVNYELEVTKSIPLDGGEVFLCKMRNVLYNEELMDEKISVGERLRNIAPFSYTGEVLGAWGEPGKTFLQK